MNNNNFVVSIPKELKHIQAKLFFGLTKRQLIGFGAAIFIGFLIFLTFKNLFNTDIAMYIMFIFVAPIFFITIYSKDGMTAEKWIKLILEYNYLHPQKRKYKITKKNIQLAKERGMRIDNRKKHTKIKSNASNSNVSRQKKKKD